MFRVILFVIFGSILLSSCEVFDPQVDQAAYVYIPSIEVDINDPAIQGTSKQKFSDAWVTINNKHLGAFELPALVPVGVSEDGDIQEGVNEISVRAGIKINGISATRLEYPSLKPFKGTVDLAVNKNDTIIPHVEYFEQKVFPWVEDFENTGFSFVETSRSDTNIIRTTDPNEVYEGNASAYFVLDKEHVRADVKTVNSYKLPRNGTPVFVEMNYKADLPFLFGVYANEGGIASARGVLVVNNKDDWNKIYINLTPTMLAHENRNVEDYSMFIYGILDTLENTTQQEYKVFVDNLKLVY